MRERHRAGCPERSDNARIASVVLGLSGIVNDPDALDLSWNWSINQIWQQALQRTGTVAGENK